MPWASFPGTTTGGLFVGAPGSLYCFSASATDTAGNGGGPSGSSCTSTPIDERAFGRNTSGWTEKTSSSYYQGTYLTAYKKNARLTLSGLIARKITLLTAVGPRFGKVEVSYLGHVIGTYSLAAAAPAMHAIELPAQAQTGRGQLSLRVVSTDTVVRAKKKNKKGKRPIIKVIHHPVRVDGITAVR